MKWINHPSALADCEYKPWQLHLARTVGLRVPTTLITNDPREARRFAAEMDDLIVKSLAEPIIAEGGTQKTIWTRRVDAAELTELAGLELTTHLFQQWIPKAYEVRLTVVGKHHFAVAIHAHSTSTRVDWRSDYDALTYTVIQCPAEVVDRAHDFLRAAGLVYGAFDFIVTPDAEDYVFLECNAAGQWGWLAEECGLPIAEAIADELTWDPE